jgi:hypothetical protein
MTIPIKKDARLFVGISGKNTKEIGIIVFG